MRHKVPCFPIKFYRGSTCTWCISNSVKRLQSHWPQNQVRLGGGWSLRAREDKVDISSKGVPSNNVRKDSVPGIDSPFKDWGKWGDVTMEEDEVQWVKTSSPGAMKNMGGQTNLGNTEDKGKQDPTQQNSKKNSGFYFLSWLSLFPNSKVFAKSMCLDVNSCSLLHHLSCKSFAIILS